MKCLALTAAALALCAPGAAWGATDGDPGETTQGSFEVSMSVTAPPAQVQVLGLQDFVLNPTTASTVDQPVGFSNQICLTMSEPGDLLVSFTQTDRVMPAGLFKVSDGNGHEALLMFSLSSNLGNTFGNGDGTFVTPADSPADCSVATAHNGHALSAIVTVPPGGAAVGNLTGQFSITIAPQT